MRDVPVADMGRFCLELDTYCKTQQPDLYKQIEEVGDIKDEIKGAIEGALKGFLTTFTASDD